MAEKKEAGSKKGGDAGAKEAPKSSMMGKLGLYIGVAVVFAGLALAVFFFVVKPKLSGGSGGEGEGKAAEGKKSEKGEKGAEEKVTSVELEPAMATVLMSDPAMPASLLMYKVSIECANEKTAALVKERKSKLAAMLADLHSFRKREELNEPQTKKSIEKVALQKANDLLQTYLEKPDPKIKILDIYHESFVVEDK